MVRAKESEPKKKNRSWSRTTGRPPWRANQQMSLVVPNFSLLTFSQSHTEELLKVNRIPLLIFWLSQATVIVVQVLMCQTAIKWYLYWQLYRTVSDPRGVGKGKEQRST